MLWRTRAQIGTMKQQWRKPEVDEGPDTITRRRWAIRDLVDFTLIVSILLYVIADIRVKSASCPPLNLQAYQGVRFEASRFLRKKQSLKGKTAIDDRGWKGRADSNRSICISTVMVLFFIAK